VHFDPGAFRELHFFQRLEDSVLVFGGDGHEECLAIQGDQEWIVRRLID
jgi:hypothetical protein